MLVLHLSIPGAWPFLISPFVSPFRELTWVGCIINLRDTEILMFLYSSIPKFPSDSLLHDYLVIFCENKYYSVIEGQLLWNI